MNDKIKVRIKGHSGCRIEVIDSTAGPILKKFAPSPDYAERLSKQAEKQQHFYQHYTSPTISFPKILSTPSPLSNEGIEMEFMPALDFITYFEVATLDEIEEVSNTLYNFIQEMLKRCELKEIPFSCLKDKYLSVKEKIISSNNCILFEDKWHHYDRYFENKSGKNLFLPVGQCHGDLTFSNILFKKEENKLVIIDFLDSFIESPIIDMVKLRQDTKYLWSLDLFEGSFDKVKISLIMEKLDHLLDNRFREYDFYCDYYKTFQLLSLLRIVPYTKDKKRIDFLIQCLEKITKDTYEESHHPSCRSII